MTVGDRIRNARIQKGVTQKELAAKLDITPQSIVQWETGARNPKPETLKRIAEALDISYWKLAGDSDDPNNELPTIQDPGFVANMILNDVASLEVIAKRYGRPMSSFEREDLIHDLVYQRSRQFRISSDMLLNEIHRQDELPGGCALTKNDLILKEILRIISELNLDGWIAVLNHVRELSKISDYQNDR